MKKTDTIFSSAGVVAGAVSIASGFYLARSVSHLSEQINELSYSSSVSDYFSSFFSSGASSVDTNEIILLKICEICAKGFGLLLIIIGLIAALAFGMKLMNSISDDVQFVPPMPAGMMPVCPPDEYCGCYGPEGEFFAPPAPETVSPAASGEGNIPDAPQENINS